jgi:hypothetical protein
VAGGQGFARHLCSSIPPNREHIVFTADDSIGTPKRQEWTRDFPIHVRLIVDEIDRGGCAIVFACGMNGGRIAETAAIFRIGLLLDGFGHDRPHEYLEKRVEALDECRKIKQSKLDILGWEWEMGLHDVIEAESKRTGTSLRLLQIPREAMDKRAVDAGDVHFYELAYLEIETETKGKEARLKLKNFVIPSPELIPDEVRKKIRRWSDYIDYWAVDFEFNDDTFHNQWQDYRTRANRDLGLTSDWHDYKKTGRYKVLVKVFDIFGNDTTQLLEVKV